MERRGFPARQTGEDARPSIFSMDRFSMEHRIGIELGQHFRMTAKLAFLYAP
jgi:hypothetical protein